MDYRNDPYKGQQGAPPVMYQPSQQVAVTVGSARPDYQTWNWCHFVTSVISFCCCQPFGLIAMVISLLAYSDHKAQDYSRSRSKRKTALGFAVAAIVLGILGFILCIVVYSLVIAAAARAVRSGNWGNNWN